MLISFISGELHDVTIQLPQVCQTFIRTLDLHLVHQMDNIGFFEMWLIFHNWEFGTNIRGVNKLRMYTELYVTYTSIHSIHIAMTCSALLHSDVVWRYIVWFALIGIVPFHLLCTTALPRPMRIQCLYIYIYIYIIVEKRTNSSHMYDHGFMDNTNRQAVCKSQ